MRSCTYFFENITTEKKKTYQGLGNLASQLTRPYQPINLSRKISHLYSKEPALIIMGAHTQESSDNCNDLVTKQLQLHDSP